jgi:Uma2 family endonuclease
MGMPAPSAPQPVTTIEALLALPQDGLRHELLDGAHVVTPSPSLRHQLVLRELYDELAAAIRGAELELFWGPADLRLGPQTLVQPDLFLIRSAPGNRPRAWTDVDVPLLAIEILSPETAARDRGAKRRLYLEAGVEEYWIVDIDARLVERWRPGDERPEVVHGTLAWSLSPGASGSLDLPALFEHLQR